MADADPPYPDHNDERNADVAVHRQSEPPRTLEEWQRWAGQAKRVWLPDPEDFWIRWPESEPWKGGQGIGWIPVAEDHPFKGREFCWRCLAEAQGFAPGVVPHRNQSGAICFEAVGDPGTEDPDEDGVQPPEVGFADPARPALAGEAEHRIWWNAGASIVRETDHRDTWPPSWTDELPEPTPPEQAVDTGTVFWEPPYRQGAV